METDDHKALDIFHARSKRLLREFRKNLLGMLPRVDGEHRNQQFLDSLPKSIELGELLHIQRRVDREYASLEQAVFDSAASWHAALPRLAPHREYRRMADAHILGMIGEILPSLVDEAEVVAKQLADGLREHRRRKSESCALHLQALRFDAGHGLFPGHKELREVERRRTLLARREDPPYWRGADLIITDAIETNDEARGSRYRNKTVIASPHAAELAATLNRLGILYSDWLGHLSKHEFFGRIGEALKSQLDDDPAASARDLMLSCLDMAAEVTRDWEDMAEDRYQQAPWRIRSQMQKWLKEPLNNPPR